MTTLVWMNQKLDDPFSGTWVCKSCGEVLDYMFGSQALVGHRCPNPVEEAVKDHIASKRLRVELESQPQVWTSNMEPPYEL